MGKMGESFQRQRWKVDLLKIAMALVIVGGLLIQSFASAVLLLCGWAFCASPLIAMKKGYAPYYWPFACGPIGLVVINLLPPLKSAENAEDYERLENRANFIGTILSWLGIFVVMIVFVVPDLFDQLFSYTHPTYPF